MKVSWCVLSLLLIGCPSGDALEVDGEESGQRASSDASLPHSDDASGAIASDVPLVDGAGSGLEVSENSDMRGMRYCEILLVYMNEGAISAEVWGTQGLNDCPAEAWSALDSEAIQDEYSALLIKMNGPRYFLMNSAEVESLPEDEPRFYGALEMRRLATLELDSSFAGAAPFTPLRVLRNNSWVFNAGEEVYELSDPEGKHYVMQAYSQIVDANLSEADLPDLAPRVGLPEGWSYEARVLSEDLRVVAEGEATVVQDLLENTYQLR